MFKKTMIAGLLATAAISVAQPALAPPNAKAAFTKGSAHYVSGEFVKARAELLAASHIDDKNPEVFLALGNACYQLGKLDEAMIAWRRVLALVPREPYATKMLTILRSQLTAPADRIAVTRRLLDERLYKTALQQCHELRRDKALTKAQAAATLTLMAEAYVEVRDYSSAVVVLQQVAVRFGELRDANQCNLLLGRAKLALGGKSAKSGLVLLNALIATDKLTPQSVRAQYELIRHSMSQGRNSAAATAMSAWITKHPETPLAQDARTLLIKAYTTLANQLAIPTTDTALSAYDKAAIAVTNDFVKRVIFASDDTRAIQTMLTHLDSRYGRAKLYGLIADSQALLLHAPRPKHQRAEDPRPKAGQQLILASIAKYRAKDAVEKLTRMVNTGKLPANRPLILAQAVKAYTNLHSAFPNAGALQGLATLGQSVARLGNSLAWPSKVVTFKEPHIWGQDIALHVIRAKADTASVTTAMAVLTSIRQQYERFTVAPADEFAIQIQVRLTSALVGNTAFASYYTQALFTEADLLSAYTHRQFTRNSKASKGAENATLSDTQKQMITIFGKLVAKQNAYATTVLSRLNMHLQPWIAAGHYQLAEQAYAELGAILPQSQQPIAALTKAAVLVGQVNRQNRRLLNAGLTIPRKLDPLHAQALMQCYRLQRGLAETDPAVAKARLLYQSIINSYAALDYFDIAEQAITLADKTPVPVAARHAQLTLAHFRLSRAQAELAETIKRYKHTRTLALTPAFASAIAEYKKYITTYPNSDNRNAALSGITSIAQLFQRHEAFDISASIYRDLAKFAATQKALSRSTPDQPSLAEGFELAVSATLSAKANHTLAASLQTRKPADGPPATLSADYRAALDAYKTFLAAHPQSPLLREALAGMSAVAIRYVKIGSWDVAEGVYADLLGAKLPLRQPERIEFKRGLCQLGKVMPSHAMQILLATQMRSLLDGRGRRAGDYDGYAMGLDKEFDGKRKTGEYLTGTMVTSRPAETKPVAPRAPSGRPADIAGRYNGPVPVATPVVVVDTLGEEITAAAKIKYDDSRAIAAIRQHNSAMSRQIAMRRDKDIRFLQDRLRGGNKKGGSSQVATVIVPVLSDAEIARQQSVLAKAYSIFQGIRKTYPRSVTAQQARGEIMTMIGHWRLLQRWPKAAALTMGYLGDNPADPELPALRLAAARDYLAWAAQKIDKDVTTQTMLSLVATRYQTARSELGKIVKAFPKEKVIRHQAQWDIANSFLTQARVVNSFSATLARGQYVRASRELQSVARKFHDHPQIGSIPQMLWTISQELSARGYHVESISVWTDIANHYPTHSLGLQASWKIAQTYQNNLRRPLLAADAYMEMNYAHGSQGAAAQGAIFQIGTQLKAEQRWVEALQVLETFVESFPQHTNAGQALTMVGQIHQANEAWEDAIVSYQRVIDEFPRGNWIVQAKWSIAECTINLSQWRKAMASYRDFQIAYPKDSRTKEATRRIGVLKDLARYQALVDEKGQRKAFDAQYQIATIVAAQLANPVKAIIEYRKVQVTWPQSHLADDALFKVGVTYLSMNQTAQARAALLEVGANYPNSPLADDALFMVGQSYETEAIALAGVTRASSIAKQKKMAQKIAYKNFSDDNFRQKESNKLRIAEFRANNDEAAAEKELARGATQSGQLRMANANLYAQVAMQQVQMLTAKQLADRQDKINAALRQAVASYIKASAIAGADKADESLLKMAHIYSDKLKDDTAAMKTYHEIVRQFSGTAVAEDASWRIAQYYERKGEFAKAIGAYQAFLRNYRRSTKAPAAQFAIAENYEHTGQWVQAMDAYTNYITNFPTGPMVQKAREQISWIKTYRL